MEGSDTAAFGKDSITGIAADFHRGDTGHLGGKSQKLQVQHQTDQFLPRVRYADRSCRQFTLNAARVVRFDCLDPAFNFPNVLEVGIETHAVLVIEFFSQSSDVMIDSIQNTDIGLAPGGEQRRLSGS